MTEQETRHWRLWLREWWIPTENEYHSPDDVVVGEDGEIGGES